MGPHRRAPRLEIQELELVILVVLTLGVAAVVGAAALLRPRSDVPRVETTRAVASMVRGAVEMYRSEHPDGSCPTVRDLVIRAYLNGSTRVTDYWERPFRIRCRGDDIEVSSSGPDGRFDTGDDIR